MPSPSTPAAAVAAAPSTRWQTYYKSLSGWKFGQNLLALIVLAVGLGGAFFIPWAKIPTPGLAVGAYGTVVWLTLVLVLGGDVRNVILNTRFARFGSAFPDQAVQETGGSGAATSAQDIALQELTNNAST